MLSFFGTWPGYDRLNYAQRFRLIRQAGFDGVCLGWIEKYERPDYRDQPAFARREGLLVENIHADFLSANHIWEDTQEGQAVFEYYLRCVDDCAAFEIPAMVIHADIGHNPPPVGALGFARFGRLIDRAERRGVTIAVENLTRTAQVDRARLLLERFDSPRFGFCFDSGHQNICRVGHEWLARWPERLMALHLHDNDGSEDQHLLPFDGNIGWPALMQAIAATGYPGAVALEVLHMGHEALLSEEFLALAYERAKRLEGFMKEAA